MYWRRRGRPKRKYINVINVDMIRFGLSAEDGEDKVRLTPDINCIVPCMAFSML